MYKLLKLFPLYQSKMDSNGLIFIKTNRWHPAYFIPRFRIEIYYWLNFWGRYKGYESALREINKVTESEETKPIYTRNIKVRAIVHNIDCGYGCDYVELFGWVPEAECPIHDI